MTEDRNTTVQGIEEARQGQLPEHTHLMQRTAELEAKNRELEAFNTKTRALIRNTQEAMENDRRNIAKDLHDNVGANLSAIKIGLEQCLAEMEDCTGTDRIALERLVNCLMETIRETKRISDGLRPAPLDSLGLLVTIAGHAKKLNEVYPQITFTSEISVTETDVPEPLKIVLYRILQEALNNICQHSGAEAAHIRLQKTGKHLQLEVSDNGCGFDIEGIASNGSRCSGYGLQRMRDRAEIFGGEFRIAASPDKGTLIRVCLPCGE